MITIYYSRARDRALQTIDSARTGAWVSLSAPTPQELDRLAKEYNLDRDNLEDAVDVYEAPRIETEDGAVYIYTRYCYPQGSEIATEPLLVIYGPAQLFTITRIEDTILERLKNDKVEFVTTQKTKTLLQVLNEINLSYERQLTVVSKRMLQIRGKLRQSQLTTREFLSIIELEEDLNEFLSALQPQASLFGSLLSGRHIRLYEEDRDIVEDISRDTTELIEQVRGRLRTLTNMRQAYDAIATTNLNKTFKRLTSIAIFLTIPTIIGGLWGMNVTVPFRDDPHAFIEVLGIVAILTALVVAFFSKKKWL